MKKYLTVLFLIFILLFWMWFVVSTHPKNAIVSWDEGFHGGAALYVTESIRYGSFTHYEYILNDFKNGIVWYPPLWLVVSVALGLGFGSSVDIFRFSSTIFGGLSLLLIFWFLLKIKGSRAALTGACTLASIPIFIIYSHLIMREVSTLFSTGLALSSFYIYLVKKKITKIEYLFICAAFSIGSLSKVIDIAIIFGVVLTTGIYLFFFLRNSSYWLRFKSIWVFLFLFLSLFSFSLYRNFTKTYLNADVFNFYLRQHQAISGDTNFILFSFLQSLFSTITVYSSEFLSMPFFSLFLFGSLFGYILTKRNFLGVYMLIWVIVTYLLLSSVKPQAQQYLLPIYFPLAITCGLFWGERLVFKSKRLSFILLSILLLDIWLLGNFYLPHSRVFYWRSTITYQEETVKYVVNNAAFGDRIITVGDGTRFLLRLYGLEKQIQTINGAAKQCDQAMTDSVEWIISEIGPQTSTKLEVDSRWLMEKAINGEKVYKNSQNTKRVLINTNALEIKKCGRILRLGRNKLTFIFKNLEYSNGAEIKVKKNVLDSLVTHTLTVEDLKKGDYSFDFIQRVPNQHLYFSVDFPRNSVDPLDSVIIESEN